MRVSLAMIVRDEEANLGRCLESVRGLFDEVIVVDTGSTDRTREIARSFGAMAFDAPWADSFAEARNAALGHAAGDYVFWLDADEEVRPGSRKRLRALLAGLRPGRPIAWELVQSSVIDGREWIVPQIRLFPRLRGVCWSRRVHESLEPALQATRIPVAARTDIVVHHRGFSDPSVYAAKAARNRRLAGLDLAERPDDPGVRLTAMRFGLIPHTFPIGQARRLSPVG